MENLYEVFKTGIVIRQMYRKKSVRIVASLFYSVVSAYCINYIYNNYQHNYYVELIIVLISLWRICILNLPIVLFCENVLFIMPSNENWKILPKYEKLSYNEIAGVSVSWKDLYLGKRIDGGVFKFSVLLNYLSVKDKQKFQKNIEKEIRGNN